MLIAVICSIAVLLVAGITVTVVLLLNNRATQNAIKASDREAAAALEEMKDVDGFKDDLLEATRQLNVAGGVEQLKAQTASIQKQLKASAGQLDKAAAGLKKISVNRLPEWRRQYISLMVKAITEERRAITEWDNLITRMSEIEAFLQTYNAAVQEYVNAMSIVAQAVDQHDNSDYAGAKATVQGSLTALAGARASLEKADKMEPSLEVGRYFESITQVETFIPAFISLCDLGASGQNDQHNAMVDQLRPQFQALSSSIGQEFGEWVDNERNRYITLIEQHLEKAAEYRKKAAEILDKNT